MVLPPAIIHPQGEVTNPPKKALSQAIEVETFDGKVFVEWDPDAAVTPLGQLPFFIEFLKIGHLFTPWVNDCPLIYKSNNAPEKIDVLGTFLLSVLSGHKRYSHITSLLNDKVNCGLLGMSKIVSDDSARRALKKIEESDGIQWLQKHLQISYEPLLKKPWILDTDVTVKPLYGHQQGADIGYNPHKPGRPSHTYHTYMMSNLRLVLEVEVQSGIQTQSAYSLPGLIRLLDRLPDDCQPRFVRGDCDWGSDHVMTQLETRKQDYLFKLKKSKYVKELIYKHHCLGEWNYFNEGWEVKSDTLQLQSWEKTRRVVIVRRRLNSDSIIGMEYEVNNQKQLAFIDGPEDIRAYEYAVLVTSLQDEEITILQHYRDRADCENTFDEMKNQWGWAGFTTQDLTSCQLISRIIALVYNWWSLFVRLANPGKRLEAITSRPLMLTSIGRLTQSGRQKRMVVTSSHGRLKHIQASYKRLSTFFATLKSTAPQLTSTSCWEQILAKIMDEFVDSVADYAQKLAPESG